MHDRNYRLKVIAAFAVVYVVWGSTYLAIRIGVHDMRPGLLAGIRFIIAGLVIIGLSRGLGQTLPRLRADWFLILLMALLMIVIGNGVVTWAEQWVESNQAALLIASSAFWTAWFGTFGKRGHKLTTRAKLGLLSGFVGVAFILAPEAGYNPRYFWAQMAILISPIAWSAGTIFSRSRDIATAPLMMAGWQMFAGGVALLAIGIAAGELKSVSWSVAGVGALVYLTVFGSCLAYATYIWLINHTTPDKLATIAYVNPAVATLLGWWLLDETLGRPQFLGMLIIIISVFVVAGAPRSSPKETQAVARS
ncbi:MAG: EamA family transporter [Gammaproteobacteria bacterium]|nr:EamA family transporter [Gammaproteobacteria bacterium]